MSESMTGIIVDGMIKPDQPLELPDQTAVSITVQPLRPSAEALAAWESIQRRLKERPINSGGVKFTRDELHERR